MKVPIISVIVCTYNRANLLDSCLASLCEQNFNMEPYEIIVVDNNSQDNTFDVVSSYMKNRDNIRYVTEGNQGLSYARNRGCDEAISRYLVYVDDDAIAPPEYLSNILEVINRHEPDICGGPIYPYYTSRKPRWFKDRYEMRTYEEASGYSRRCRISGSNYVIKKRVLKEVGMFDPEIGMKGDRIGVGAEAKVLNTYRNITHEADQKVYYALECYIRHHVPHFKMTIKYIMMRSYLSGRVATILGDKKSIIRLVIRLPVDFIWGIFNEIKRHGILEIDYIYIFRSVFSDMGLIVETLNQRFRKNPITVRSKQHL